MKKFLLVLSLCSCLACIGQKKNTASIIIQYNPDHPLNTFIPSQFFGAGFDGHGNGETDVILKQENIEAMLSSGYKPLTYRLRSELANEVWHWNPKGRWSDEKNEQG